MLGQFTGNAWGQVQTLRISWSRPTAHSAVSPKRCDKSGSDMASQAQGFNDILVTIQTSAETLAIASERLADLAEDLGARRCGSQERAIG